MSQVNFLATVVCYCSICSNAVPLGRAQFPWEGPGSGLVCFSNNVSFKSNSIYLLSYFKS